LKLRGNFSEFYKAASTGYWLEIIEGLRWILTVDSRWGWVATVGIHPSILTSAKS
jgi:hypothetical protein